MLHTLSAHEICDKFKKKELSAKEITAHFLERIRKEDPKIKSFLHVDEEYALKKAASLDEGLHAGGKLAGVPIAIKDAIHVEGLPSTAGSKIIEGYHPPFSSTAVRLLEEEGAIILGKTNCDEFAMGSSTENSAYFPTKNPWNLELTPGGSSGGSAAAVAARLVPIALGTDTGGSIRQPASFCGIVGLKPTYGRVSRYGLIAYGSSLDQIGPMTTNSLDAALTMEVIGRSCDRDATSLQQGAESIVDSLKSASLKNKRVGVAYADLEGLKEETKSIFMAALEDLKALGATIVEIELPLLKYSLPTYYIVACAEASTNLARYDGIRYGHRSKKAKTLEEVYTLSKEEGFGAEVKRRILLGTFVLSKGYQDAFYTKAQKVRRKIQESYQQAFKKCDFIASPVTPFSAFKIGAIQDPLQMYLEDIYTISINLAGLPAISVPAALTKEALPMGLQLIGAPLSEGELLRASHLFEARTGCARKIPGGF